jgi:hypothetical protein
MGLAKDIINLTEGSNRKNQEELIDHLDKHGWEFKGGHPHSSSRYQHKDHPDHEIRVDANAYGMTHSIKGKDVWSGGNKAGMKYITKFHKGKK